MQRAGEGAASGRRGRRIRLRRGRRHPDNASKTVANASPSAARRIQPSPHPPKKTPVFQASKFVQMAAIIRLNNFQTSAKLLINPGGAASDAARKTMKSWREQLLASGGRAGLPGMGGLYI
ncbi:MAG: hypothetical protein J0I23_06540 [Rhizobiales bacterium]|nr:hypothetical protein [Hyphomicrobiales bacterium]